MNERELFDAMIADPDVHRILGHDVWPLISDPSQAWCRTCQTHYNCPDDVDHSDEDTGHPARCADCGHPVHYDENEQSYVHCEPGRECWLNPARSERHPFTPYRGWDQCTRCAKPRSAPTHYPTQVES